MQAEITTIAALSWSIINTFVKLHNDCEQLHETLLTAPSSGLNSTTQVDLGRLLAGVEGIIAALHAFETIMDFSGVAFSAGMHEQVGNNPSFSRLNHQISSNQIQMNHE
jgi:hypothetical protein